MLHNGLPSETKFTSIEVHPQQSQEGHLMDSVFGRGGKRCPLGQNFMCRKGQGIGLPRANNLSSNLIIERVTFKYLGRVCCNRCN